MTRPPFLLGPDPASPFPPPRLALRAPDGLLAVGGDLSPTRLLAAYRQGIFPWYSRGQPILWWSPDPRMVFETASFGLASRFRRALRGSAWVVRADTAFEAVLEACAQPRPGQEDTWILPEMARAYAELHRQGHAHSIEVFDDGDRLAGGIYAVSIGRMVFGESMFSAQSGGSKLALAGLIGFMRERGWPLLDAQLENPHLRSLGARRLPRAAFLALAAELSDKPGLPGPWTRAFGERPAAAYGRADTAAFCAQPPPVA